MPSIINVVILIKDPRRCHHGRQCAKELINAGARVLLYCMCADMPDEDQKAQLPLLSLMAFGAECYLDDPQLADRYGLSHMPMGRLTERLKDADRVIPF